MAFLATWTPTMEQKLPACQALPTSKTPDTSQKLFTSQTQAPSQIPASSTPSMPAVPLPGSTNLFTCLLMPPDFTQVGNLSTSQVAVSGGV